MRMRVLAAGVLSIVCATSALADVCNPNDLTLLKPDLVAEAPSKIRLLTRGRVRELLFTTTIDNVGDGPLVLDGQTVSGAQGAGTRVTQIVRRTNGTTCTHDVGFFPFGDGEERFHIDDFAEYQLRLDDPFTGPIVARFSKTEFCLLNIVQLRGSRRAPDFFDCDEGPMGISVGFANEEDSQAPGQALNLDANPITPVPAGDYFLVIVVNPNGAILEKTSNTPADAGVASVAVGGHSQLPRAPRPRPTRRPVHNPQPGSPTPTPSLPPGSTPPRTPIPPTPTPTLTRPVHPGVIVLPPGHEGCGGNKNKICSSGEFCQFPENRCGLVGDTGICTPMSVICDPTAAAVCGCDGVTYRNDCERQRAGTSRAHQGPC